MGWKPRRIEGNPKTREPLSENQCGMETSSSLLRIIVTSSVEREPMWDGNCGGERPILS